MLFLLIPVCEVVQTLQLSFDRDPQDIVGDLSICLDGMQVDPEAFALAEREQGKASTNKVMAEIMENFNTSFFELECQCYIGFV